MNERDKFRRKIAVTCEGSQWTWDLSVPETGAPPKSVTSLGEVLVNP